MKRVKTILIAAGVFGLVVLFATSMPGLAKEPKAKVPDTFLKMKNPISSSPRVLEEAKEIYEAKCKKCHGSKGDGKGPGAKQDMDPLPSDWTIKADMDKVPDGRMFWITLNGSEDTDMLGWKKGVAHEGKEVSEDQAWKLVHYIRQFAK
ncbi:MAG: hypothetical protein A2073_04530 [Deltaproteobacteria bacterium GWC2_42_11]|nr:MAG: hypothetical protein A2073_04530 [Deltaproteobacteria bacterium GWC2_42_11]